MRNSVIAGALLALSALVVGGCTVRTVDSAPAAIVLYNGTLTVDWSINGYKDPNLCAQSAASSIQIDVATTAGQAVGSYAQACTAFATSVTLSQGSYFATATLVDSAGTARTTGVQIDPFTIRGNDDVITPIDFPSSSFY